GQGSNVGGLAFSPDGKVLAASDHQVIRLWDVADGKELRPIQGPGGRLSRLAFSPDGHTLAATCNEGPETIVLYHAGTGKELRRLALPAVPRPVVAPLAFSPDGKTLTAASGTNVLVRRWDAATGRELPPLGSHGGGLTCLAYSADGKSLAAGCLDRVVTVW